MMDKELLERYSNVHMRKREFGISKRSTMESTFDILIALSVKGPLKPTPLMYQTNLNWISLNEKLTQLKNAEFIQPFIVKRSARNRRMTTRYGHLSIGKYWMITLKGEKCLNKYLTAIEPLINNVTQSTET